MSSNRFILHSSNQKAGAHGDTTTAVPIIVVTHDETDTKSPIHLVQRSSRSDQSAKHSPLTTVNMDHIASKGNPSTSPTSRTMSSSASVHSKRISIHRRRPIRTRSRRATSRHLAFLKHPPPLPLLAANVAALATVPVTNEHTPADWYANTFLLLLEHSLGLRFSQWITRPMNYSSNCKS